MADPFRLRVLKALCEQIKTVTPTNDRSDGEPYVNDLSDYIDAGGTVRPRVSRGRDIFGPSDPLPLVSVLEHPRPLDQSVGGAGSTASMGEWELIIQGFVEDDPDNPTDPAHVLAAEVISAIVPVRSRRGGLFGLGEVAPCVEDMKINTSPVVRPADDTISTTAFFYMTVTLKLVEDLHRPFATS